MPIAKSKNQAPDFSLPDMDGRDRKLQDWLRDGPLLLAFFKVSCPTCQYTFPFLARLHEQAPAARLVGISQDGRRKTEQFNREYGVRFPVLLDAEDDGYAVSNAYGLTHVPTLFLIEPDGRITLTSQGFVKADLEQIARRFGPAALFRPGERVESFRAG